MPKGVKTLPNLKSTTNRDLLDVRLSQIQSLLLVLSTDEVLETIAPHTIIDAITGIMALVEQSQGLTAEVQS